VQLLQNKTKKEIAPTFTRNEIYIQKKNKILINYHPALNSLEAKERVATFARNLESLGYTISKDIYKELLRFPIEELTAFYNEIVEILKKQVGAHVQFRPMYPNFPQQVMDASDLELFFNAIVHYWSGGTFLPHYEKKERAALAQSDKLPLKVLDLGTEEDFFGIFTNLVGANTSISDNDKKIVKWFIHAYGESVEKILPAKIPQKEQLALVAAELLKNTKSIPDKVRASVKGATDVLRIAAALNDGDVSLSEKTKFRKMPRSLRVSFLHLLESVGTTENITEDMLRHRMKWVCFGEVLHPGEYAKRFPKTAAAFDIIRNDKPFQAFNGQIEELLIFGYSTEVARILAERPGDFARRLDHILRLNPEKAPENMAKFLEVAHKVSTPVLLQVFNHFKNRNPNKSRAVFPKGNVAKIQILAPLGDKNSLHTLAPLAEDLALEVRSVLVERFSKLPSLGKVYLDEKLKNYIVPFSQRSASKSLRTLARGSKIDFPDCNTVRFFLWWHNTKDGGRVDIDLSALMVDNGWKNPQHISYYNLRNEKRQCAHSGDIVNAPQGACEFIDINVPSFVEDGGRYVIMCLNSYTQQPFCDLPECFAGICPRNAPKSGEVFEARTVLDKIDVAANTTICVPCVLDLFDRKLIWTDLAFTNRSIYNNVYSNEKGLLQIAQAMENLNKPTLYDLLEMHAQARGTLVQNKEESQTVFSEHEGLTPYDSDEIISKYLA
jgi:hypothetical protein